MEKQTRYELTYDFSLDEFIDFMMIQSNVNEKIERGIMSVEEVRCWMKSSLEPIFNDKKRTLIFEGYNWYIRKS